MWKKSAFKKNGSFQIYFVKFYRFDCMAILCFETAEKTKFEKFFGLDFIKLFWLKTETLSIVHYQPKSETLRFVFVFFEALKSLIYPSFSLPPPPRSPIIIIPLLFFLSSDYYSD